MVKVVSDAGRESVTSLVMEQGSKLMEIETE